MNIFRSSVCFVLMSFFNICTASQTLLDDDQSSADCTPAETPTESRARFASHSDDEVDDTHDGTAESPPQNATFAARAGTAPPSTASTHPEQTPPAAAAAAQSNAEDIEEYVNVPKQAKILPEFSIVGGMFDALVIPISTMPYTAITLSGCSCQALLDPSTFQNNLALVRINLNGSQLNFRDFEEKFGEGCLNLNCIDLMNTIDSSVVGYLIITPERFAQLAHPDILQRILHGHCSLSISHPAREGECYTVPEMQEKFLSSILQLRSLNKAKETLSAYGKLIEMLRAGVEGIDPKALAAAGGRAVFKVYTGV